MTQPLTDVSRAAADAPFVPQGCSTPRAGIGGV